MASKDSSKKPRVVLAVTGSVATIKLPLLTAALLEFCELKVIATDASRHFINESELPEACVPILGDEDDWRKWNQVGDPVLHIELRRWADVLLIAPLSANTLAKIANGLCDNLLTCLIRAWDFSKPMIIAPAMNSFMWESPFTARHLDVCTQLGVVVIPPVEKKLACGDVGAGGMASVEDIAAICREKCVEHGLT